MMLKRVSPHIWLTILVLGWGVVMTLMCVVQNYSGLIACRIFLGIFEVCGHPPSNCCPSRPAIDYFSDCC